MCGEKHILREGGWRRQRRTLATGVTTEVMVMADMVCVRGTVVGVGCAGSLTVQIGPKLGNHQTLDVCYVIQCGPAGSLGFCCTRYKHDKQSFALPIR